MQEGCLSETMPPRPANPYAKAKNDLRIFLEQQQSDRCVLKWIRLFYMYGKGQNPNSLFSQLETALANHQERFNMSGGEQVRDYLHVDTVAQYLTKIARLPQTTGVINCCSGQPVTVKKMVEDYLTRSHRHISLNLGYYPYPDYEPFRFWGDASKLKTILHNE
jgi:dTDP-6-deoxy-L-talose 4-dehydrogenase (NAD+)